MGWLFGNNEERETERKSNDIAASPFWGGGSAKEIRKNYTKEQIDKHGNVQIDMHDYGSFEKVGDLPWDLPTNDEEITTVPGDVILYQGNKVTIYYDENTWNFTKLGHLNATSEEIQEAFGGKGDIKAEFFVEWTE